MAALRRYLQSAVEQDLARKMVFVGGPRQVGKTQFGKMIISDPAAYLNFDIPAHRDAILKGELPPTAAWFFDEIQKYRAWRNYLKGLYDAAGGRKRILVTGSARSYRGSRNPSWGAAIPKHGAGPWPFANGWCAKR